MSKGRFLLFKGDVYYPLGGALDFDGFAATREEAEIWVRRNHHDALCEWANAIDAETGEIIPPRETP